MNTFHQVPYNWNFEINADGDLRLTNDSSKSSLSVTRQYEHMIPKFLAMTFIGPIDLPVLSKSPIPNARDITYEVSRITQLNENDFDFDGNLFRRIPGFENHLISENGVVWSTRRKIFIHAAYNHAEYMTVSIKDNNGIQTPRKVHRLVYATYIGPLDPLLVIDHKDDHRNSNHWSNLQQITSQANARKALFSDNHPLKNIWTPETVEKVCQMLEANTPTIEIAKAIGDDYQSMRKTFNHRIHRIRSGKIYTDISKKYDLSHYNSTINKRNTVLTEADVRDIIVQLSMGNHIADIARQYRCTPSTITNIRDMRTWKSIPRQ